MATISAVKSVPSATNVPVVTWTGVATANTMTPLIVDKPIGLSASVQLTGTWGASTVVLQGSLDGTTYFTLKDVGGSAISATANAYFEFSATCPYIKPSSSGGTADSVNVVICFRGPVNA